MVKIKNETEQLGEMKSKCKLIPISHLGRKYHHRRKLNSKFVGKGIKIWIKRVSLVIYFSCTQQNKKKYK